MKKLQWLFWILVLVIGASLPWTVRDLTSDESGEIAEATSETRTLAAQAADFFREKWFALAGPGDDGSDGNQGSLRFQEVAARVTPLLETEFAGTKFEVGAPIFIRIFKESSELELWMEPAGSSEFELFKTYKICRWSGKLGPKLKEGDRQAPEGFYFVSPDRMNPNSDFHLSFDLGFPNEYDRHHKRTGSFLMVHGDCVSIGCYAMTDSSIEEIYTLADAAFAKGQRFFRVHAFPFRMTDERMDKLDEKDEWFDYWANLKEGYDYFEMLKQPPNVSVEEGAYRFGNQS